MGWRDQIINVLKLTFKDKGAKFVMVLSASLFTFLYLILLPFNYTQRFSFRNLTFLTPYLTIWPVVLGTIFSLSFTLEYLTLKEIIAAKSSSFEFTRPLTQLFSFVLLLLPSLLCCTPIIPTLLAFLSLSRVGLYQTTGLFQHFFATHQREFLAATALFLITSLILSLRKLGNLTCCQVSNTRPSKERLRLPQLILRKRSAYEFKNGKAV